MGEECLQALLDSVGTDTVTATVRHLSGTSMEELADRLAAIEKPESSFMLHLLQCSAILACIKWLNEQSDTPGAGPEEPVDQGSG